MRRVAPGFARFGLFRTEGPAAPLRRVRRQRSLIEREQEEPRRLDRQAQVDETEDQDEGAGGAEEERRVVEGAKHVASLLDEAAAGPSALRALPAGPQLLERRRCPRLINVTTVGAQPLSRPMAPM